MTYYFKRYNRNFSNQPQQPGQYAVAVLDGQSNVIGYAPPYDKDSGFAIVDKDKAMIYPRSSNAYTRIKGMHIAKSMTQQKIVSEMQQAQQALTAEQVKTKPNTKRLKALASTLSEIQQDLYDINGYQFRIEKIG